jgi:Cys-tRNA(Pro) deacylase
MPAEKYPVTPAIRALRSANVVYAPHLYDYVEHGGTRHSAEALGVSEHTIVKTLVMETELRKPLIVLMHGDREVAVGLLARAIGAKSVAPCRPEVAQKHTGYLVGGTSPFGTRTLNLPVYVERTILELPEIYLNGGKRGFLVSLAPSVLIDTLGAVAVDVSAPMA